MNLGPYASFILTAYAVAMAIVAGLILWVVLDRRTLTRRLEEVESQGMMRRSERATPEKA